jgi:hypothetical protein
MAYLVLLVIQLFGAVFFVWQELPEFSQIVTNPGAQLPKDAPVGSFDGRGLRRHWA